MLRFHPAGYAASCSWVRLELGKGELLRIFNDQTIPRGPLDPTTWSVLAGEHNCGTLVRLGLRLSWRRSGGRVGSKALMVGLMAAVLAIGCDSATPTAGCVTSQNCPAGQICQQGTCVLPSLVACTSDTVCIEALAGGSWKTPAPSECQAPRCVEKVCKLGYKEAGSACSDDGKTCTTDSCDGQGTCGHGELKKEACLIDGTCATAGSAKAGNPCLVCAPAASPSQWTPAAAGASCTTDELGCTVDQCDGKGSCSAATLKPGTCLLADATGKPACYQDGAAVDPAKPCEVCDAANPKAIKSLADGAPCQGDSACQVGTCLAGACDKIGVDPASCLIDSTGCVAANDNSPDNPCLHCDPKVSQKEWTKRKAGDKCDSDSVPCTQQTCNGNGSCDIVADHGACTDKAGPCTLGECDKDKGCVALAKSTTATCEGDAVACTVENCDGQGGCNKTGTATDGLCDDKFTCTLDKCDAKGGCQHTPDNFKCADGNECTSDACDVKKGCVNDSLSDGSPCSGDTLDCTADSCNAGTCKANLKADFCVLQGKCIAKGGSQNGGCQVCDPSLSTALWTSTKDGSACTDDGIACSLDACTAGACSHTGQPSLCDDGIACTADVCDTAKGCQNPDACPWGHGCSKAAGACLTDGGKAIELTATSASDPNPTNPALARHDLQGGGQRTWVAWQSDSCMAVESGGWVVKKGARLQALPLDPQLLAPGQKVKPQALTLPVASFFGASTTVCQAFPQFAADPLVPTQAWLTWLEADPGQVDAAKGCLGNGGQGGVVRIARLDGKSASGKVDVAGEVCTYKEGTPPLFLTAGLAVLDGSQADWTNVNQRGILTVRPNGTSLKIWSTSLALKAKVIGDSSLPSNMIGQFAKVHPVVVDFGSAAIAAERYLALGVEEDAGAFSLWGTHLKADGTKGALASWTSATPVAEVFAGASNVCSIDATVNSAGTLGAVAVLRKGGQDLVVLVSRDSKGLVKAEQLFAAESQGDCRVGVAAARLAWTGKAWLPMVFETLASTVPLQGSVKYLWNNSALKLSLPQGIVAATLDNASAGGPTHALAWRAVARPVALGSAMATAIEAVNGTDARSIHVWSWVP